VRASYDAQANAAYLRFAEDAVAESEEVSAGIVLDYDAVGRLVAIEVLGASERFAPEVIAAFAAI
jgi:uncharacterized protein YuzE